MSAARLPHISPGEIEAANEYERRIAWTVADRVANVQRWLPTDDVSTARRDLSSLVEQLEAAREALRQIRDAGGRGSLAHRQIARDALDPNPATSHTTGQSQDTGQ